MNIEEIKKIKAKSDGTTLYEHTCMVIETGLKLLQSLSLSNSAQVFLKQNFLQAAILHDLGKVHPTFQKRLSGDKNASIRHELVSVWFAETFLEVNNAVLFAVATHHKSVESSSCNKSLSMQDLNGISISIDEGAYLPDSEGTMCLETLQSWLSLFSEDFVYRKEKLEKIPSSFCYMFRENKQKKAIPCLEDRQRFSLLRAFLQAADHLASGGQTKIPDYQLISLDNFQPHDKLTIYPFRHFQEELQHWVGDAILHAPTGSGKTEAALSWVYANQLKGNRLFYLLPYTASINAMMTRLCDVYNRSEVMIQHSKSLNFIYNELCEEYSNVVPNYTELEKEARNLNSLSREVYYPIKIMTLHQLLRIPCHGKGWEFSMLECQNALFIVDEFHAYNAFLTGKMLGTVKIFREFFGAKFLFMSATIPVFLLEQIVEKIYEGDYSRIIRPDSAFTSDACVMGRKRHHLVCHANENISQYIGQIESDLEKGLSVLVVVNNVKTCQQIYQTVDCDDSRKMMLHGGFNQKSRRKIENFVTHADKSKRPRLLVATQAVEVSLDIDYNTAYIENAPIDSLIQRLGRVNRGGKLVDASGNKIMANVYLFEEIIGKTPFYDERLLQDTWTIMSQLDEKDLSEDDLIRACNEVYKNGYSEKQKQDFEQGLRSTSDFVEKWIAGMCKDWADEIMEQNNQKVDVLCYNLKEEYCSLIEQKRYIEANELLVAVYPYHWDQTVFSKDWDVRIAQELFYDEKQGCIEKKPDCYEII
ncbi:CRISPR-associated helicase Cas3' [Phocaeicola plebeius]|uniref:CRISPR-associated helicase Cas3' n=1 Tax=Phocaeicola plebeius TaxID=310297 RepID=UPI00266C2EAD|nr:CRISPR-associated helicase Cas3' [Phocaeicola plebeius]